MQVLFVADQQKTEIPARTLCVDGLIDGVDAVYSHWQGAESPAALAHDLSTGIVARAAREAEQYLSTFKYVANNHVDADGLLSMALAVHTDLLQYEEVMIDAAAYGDFNHYRSEAGARLAMTIHQEVSAIREQGGAWEQRCFDLLIPRMSEIIQSSMDPDQERDAQIQLIEQRINDLSAQQSIRLITDKALALVTCDVIHGHTANDLCSVYVPDDLPLWSLNKLIGPAYFQLLCLQSADGCLMQLNAPTHSWAQTIDLPKCVWPDLNDACKLLQEIEEHAITWVTGEASRVCDFTCLLAAVDDQNKLAASSLNSGQVMQVLADYL